MEKEQLKQNDGKDFIYELLVTYLLHNLNQTEFENAIKCPNLVTILIFKVCKMYSSLFVMFFD